MKIVLASASPRRLEILGKFFSDLIVCPANGEEHPPKDATPAETVRALSMQKAEEVSAKFEKDDLIIAADTVVAIDGKILGKPHSEKEAEDMLKMLSGREHTVFTGVSVIKNGVTVSEHEETAVRFRELSEREIKAYIATGESMDKAGAYGVQQKGGAFVSGITGDYFNVMGLPICRLGLILGRLGVDLI